MDKLSNDGFFFILSILLFSFCQVSTMACMKEEKEALLKLKASFIDPSKRLASWRGEDCCKWDGVFCNKNSGHVIKLDLQNPVNFSTSLLTNGVDSSLLELKYLNYLDLSGNYFNYSQIPTFIGSMVELRFLNLSHAWFYGRVPHYIGNLTNLVHLDINNDKFSYGGGDFVNKRMLFIDDIEWISSLGSLESLDLSGVNLEEALNLMHVIKNLPSLLSLKLRLCNLQRIHLSHAFSNSSFLSRIRVLDLSYNMFDSAIPEAFQNMTSLRFLYLSNNHFTSSIPLWFGNLQNLVVVSLESNLFTSVEVGLSSIVRSNCHLKVFDLSDNGFLQGDVFGIHGNLSFGCNEYDLEVLDLENTTFGASRIPDWLGQLKNLKYLNLKNTSLYGPIPDSFGNLSSIESIDVSKNMLSGGIPSSFGKQLNLKRLRLDNNKLDGVIDNSFGQLQSLEMLDISKNSFKGVVSEIHFVNLSRLFILNMDRNSLLSFNVKPNWVPPFQLKFLSMRSCKGTGLPLWIQTQKEIISLDLANTSISGAIPTWLEGPNLLSLDLSYNQITGSLSRSIIDQMPNLKVLFLSDNHIYGSLPPSVCKLKQLIALDLSNNRLSGTIPSCFSTLNVLLLDLSSNELSGIFPSSLGNLSSLRQLYLGYNNFKGEFPITLRTCENLILLDLAGNRYFGSIPMWLGESLGNLQVLKLRDNMFNDTIPSSLFLLPYLQVLDLAENKLVGDIPRNIDNFEAMSRRDMMKQQVSEICIAVASNVKVCFEREFRQVFKARDFNYSFPGLNLMVLVDLSNNNLVGTIPTKIVELTFIVGLNLSHNNLSGTIPEDIGRMTSLQSLDISFNQLSGPIPLTMSNLNSLGVLMLSNNNFSGRIPREGHLLTFNDAYTYDDNPYLCGDPLLIKCPSEKYFEPPSGVDSFDSEKREKMWLYMIIIVGYATGFWVVVGVLIFKRSWRCAYFKFMDEAYEAIQVSMSRLKWPMRRNNIK